LPQNRVSQSDPIASVLGRTVSCFCENAQWRLPQGRLAGVEIEKVLELLLRSLVCGVSFVDKGYNVFESS